MILTRADLFELTLPLAEPFIISGGVMRERRSLVVRLADDAGHEGYGESPPFELPFYSDETLVSARDLLQRVLLPRVVGRSFDSPEALDQALRPGIRGNPFARAGIETAGWDLFAAREQMGIAQLLAERMAVTAAVSIPCGVALGIPEDREPATVVRWVSEALARGYRRVKVKVAPGWDVIPLRGVRDAMEGSGIPLTVDANGSYRWPEHSRILRALDAAGLLYIEQPLAPEELLGHAALTKTLKTPICLDETLHGASAARQIIALEGPRVWNIKVHRMGGLSETLEVYKVAARRAVKLWAGTMPESGIGSQAAIAAAALPDFRYPSDIEPSARWFGPGVDVIELEMNGAGQMAVPTRSIAALLDRDRFAAATRLLATFSPTA